MLQRKRKGPLDGLRVLELSQIMAGPVAGMMLADMGAEIIKVEKLPGGDDARAYAEPRINGVSAPFLMVNRGKKSIGLDLKKAEARQALLLLVAQADVVTENFRAGTMEKLGLGYEVMREVNPALIYCAVSGFGRNGPLANHGGFDLIAQGYAGLMSITGQAGEPMRYGSSVADINAGILSALGIVSAYVHRLKTGEGQQVETSLLEAGLQQTYWHAAILFATGESAQGNGNAHVLIAPYQTFKASDGWINIAGANQTNWERLAKVLGRPEWLSDARFASNAFRLENRVQLESEINAILATRSRAEWTAALDAVGVPVGPVHSIGEAFSHPQTIARDMVVQMDHNEAGAILTVGSPLKFNGQSTVSALPAPMLGQHTIEILQASGLDEQSIEALLTSGAAYQHGRKRPINSEPRS